MRERLFQIIQLSRSGDTASRIYDVLLTIIAIISITPIIADNLSLTPMWRSFFDYLEIASVLVLLADYVLRWSTHDYLIGSFKWTAFVRYPFSPLAIITMVAIAPTFSWVPRSLGYLRLLRFLVLFRNVRSFQLLINVFKKRKRVLITVVGLSGLYLVAAAVIMSSLEPQMFSRPLEALLFVSTVDSIIVAHPKTIAGILFGSFSFIVGISFIMMPVGILTSGFVEEIQNQPVGFGMQYSRSDIKRLKAGFFDGLKGISESFRTKPNMRIYASIMGVSFAITAIATILLSSFSLGTWIGYTGIAFAAFALEPIAGILVALGGLSVHAIMTGEIGQILSMFVCAVTVICFGFILRRSRKVTAGRVGLVVLVSLLFYPIMVVVASTLANEPIYDSYLHTNIAQAIVAQGVSEHTAMLTACILDLQVSFLLIIPLVFLLAKAFDKQLKLLNTWAAEQKEFRIANHMFMPPELAVMEYTSAGVFDLGSKVPSGYPAGYEPKDGTSYEAAETTNPAVDHFLRIAAGITEQAVSVSAVIWLQGDRIRIVLLDDAGTELESRALLTENVSEEGFALIREDENESANRKLASITLVLSSSKESNEQLTNSIRKAHPNVSIATMSENELMARAII